MTLYKHSLLFEVYFLSPVNTVTSSNNERQKSIKTIPEIPSVSKDQTQEGSKNFCFSRAPCPAPGQESAATVYHYITTAYLSCTDQVIGQVLTHPHSFPAIPQSRIGVSKEIVLQYCCPFVALQQLCMREKEGILQSSILCPNAEAKIEYCHSCEPLLKGISECLRMSFFLQSSAAKYTSFEDTLEQCALRGDTVSELQKESHCVSLQQTVNIKF